MAGRTIPTALKPALYRLYSEPIQIVDLFLEAPYTTASDFYCINNQDIVFGGNTYTAIAAKRSSIKSEEGTVLQEITVQLDNIDLEFRQLIASGMLNRKRCDIRVVFNGFLTNSANFITLYSGFLDAPSGDNRWVSLIIKPFPIFERDYPRRLFQVMCNWLFGDSQCTMLLSNYQVVGAEVGAASTQSYLNFVDPDAGRVSDYFAPGYVLMTSGALEGEVRPVLGSIPTQVSLRVALSNIPEVGDTFTVQKLCAKNITACQAFSNYINYGGFPHVPLQPSL